MLGPGVRAAAAESSPVVLHDMSVPRADGGTEQVLADLLRPSRCFGWPASTHGKLRDIADDVVLTGALPGG